MNKKIAAIVVTYNRKVLLEECITALVKAKENSNLDIILIDNASTDGTEEMIKEKFCAVTEYVNTGSNLGGAGGFNFGIKYAMQKNIYDYCWIMDDDTIVQSDTLSVLLRKADVLNNDFSFLSSVALWKDGTLCNMNVQKVSSKTVDNYEQLKDGLAYIEYASFVSLFINTEAIKKVGYPIKDFFIYGDDMEYTMRLNTYKNGFLVGESQVIHKMAANEGINIIEVDSKRIERYFYNYRNLLYIYRTYDGKEYKKYKLKCYYMIFKVLLKAKSDKFKRINAIRKALSADKKFNPVVETYY